MSDSEIEKAINAALLSQTGKTGMPYSKEFCRVLLAIAQAIYKDKPDTRGFMKADIKKWDGRTVNEMLLILVSLHREQIAEAISKVERSHNAEVVKEVASELAQWHTLAESAGAAQSMRDHQSKQSMI